MAWNVLVLPSSKESRVKNVKAGEIDLKLDGMDTFSVTISDPFDWQITDIVGDVEIKIDAGTYHKLYGYIKNHKYNKNTRQKVITGVDYEILLKDPDITTDYTSNHNASLSSGKKVVYTSTAFATIAADLVACTKCSVGSIDTYPAAGPDTSLDVKFEYMKARAGLKYLGGYGQDSNVEYDLWVNTSKAVYLEDRRGRATPVIGTLKDGNGCVVVDYEGDTIRVVKRVTVLGDGNGAGQTTGNWPAAGFTKGDPEETYLLPGLTDSTMAQTIAKNIYTARNGEIAIIQLKLDNADTDVQLGDAVYFESVQLGISKTEYRVTRIRKTLRDNKETLFIYLSVSGNKQRKRTMNEILADNAGLQKLSGSASTLSKNYSVWGSGINAKTGQPLKVGFYVSDDLITDSGSINVTDLKVDYDVDAFNQQYGGASFDGSDPQVQNSSGGDQPDVINTSANQDASVSNSTSEEGGSSVITEQDSKNESKTVGTATTIHSLSMSDHVAGVLCVYTFVDTNDWDTNTSTGGVVWAECNSVKYGEMAMNLGAGSRTFVAWIPIDVYGQTVYIKGTRSSGSSNWDGTALILGIGEHSHGAGSLSADDHQHGAGTYDAEDHQHPNGAYDVNAADIDNISISDGVGEAGVVNASEVNIYLDYWNGAAWVNKHSVLNTGKTLDNDVDISNGGTYPDATGYWRIRVETDSASADFVQAKVKMGYYLNN